MIVPRAPSNVLRISRLLFRGLWKIWPPLAARLFRSEDRREDFLATFAPFSMIMLLAAWIASLMLGYGLVFYAVRGELNPSPVNLGDAVYYAGSSLFTVRYDAMAGAGIMGRTASILAALSGIGLVAVVIAFLFAIFASFQQRETFVVSIGARAGAPPSGTGLLVIHGRTGIAADLAQVFRDGQTWTAQVMESHLAYPALVYFRSSHDYESWIGTLGTLLDAAALVMTVLEGKAEELRTVAGQARILYNAGRHLTHDFSHYFDLEAQPSAGIDRSEFDTARRRLSEAGFTVDDSEEAWIRFSELRSTYAGHLNAMARWLEIPPVQWVGDRSLIAVQHVRAQTPERLQSP